MSFEPFDVVVVPFPFSDKDGSRRRPALVVSTAGFNRHHGQIILAMITAARRSHWASDVELEDWPQAGLTTACRVRLKLFTLDRDLVVRRIGGLTARDQKVAREALSRSLAVA